MSQVTNDLSAQSEEDMLNIEGLPPPSYFRECKGTILTFGAFDGVHRGHQAILQKVVERANELHVPSVALVFRPRPVEAIRSTTYAYLTARDETVRLIKELGIEHVGILKFTKELAETRAGPFLRQLMLRLPFCELWLGADALVGKAPEGQPRSVRPIAAQLGFSLEIFNPPDVSSRGEINLQLFGAEDFNSITQSLGRQFKVPAYIAHDSCVKDLEDVRCFEVLTPNFLLLPPDGDYVVHVCPAIFGTMYPPSYATNGYGLLSIMRSMLPDSRPRLSLLAESDLGWAESFVQIEFIKAIKLRSEQLWQLAAEYMGERSRITSNNRPVSSFVGQISLERDELLDMFIRNGHLTTPQPP